MSATDVDGRRAIGERNAESILDAALRVLSADPGAGMLEVAAEAGVGRATLYRHYATRDALIEALRERFRTTFRALVAEIIEESPDAVAGLERLVHLLFEARDSHKAIAPPDNAKSRERGDAVVWRPLEALVERGQRDGQLDPEPSARWLVASLRGQVRAAAEELESGTLTRRKAPDAVMRAFLSGYGATRS